MSPKALWRLPPCTREIAWIRDATHDRARRHRLGTGEVRTSLRTLTALEIAVGAGDHPLAQAKAFASGEKTH